jgi:ABC-type sulfate transport system permease subunit
LLWCFRRCAGVETLAEHARTQTLTQYVADRYMAFDLTGAYAAAPLLGALAMISVLGDEHAPPRNRSRLRCPGAICAATEQGVRD